MPEAFESITLAELAEKIAKALRDGADPDSFVAFASSYGDMGNTQQIHRLVGRVNPEQPIVESPGYSVSGWALAGDEFEELEDEEQDAAPTVTIIA